MKDESHYYYLQCYRSKSDGVSVARCQLLIPIQLSILSITIDYQLPILYARSFLMALYVHVCVSAFVSISICISTSTSV